VHLRVVGREGARAHEQRLRIAEALGVEMRSRLSAEAVDLGRVDECLQGEGRASAGWR
jgi:hypothetical protein